MQQGLKTVKLTKCLIVDMNKCTGCMACVLACSSLRMGLSSPSHSRIRVLKFEKSGVDAPVFCQQCEEPRCLEACPKGAISRQDGSGLVEIDTLLCDRCLICASACPYGAITSTPDNRKRRSILKCDLCGGNPGCIQWCETAALQLVDGNATERIHQAREDMIYARKRFEIEHDMPLWRHLSCLPKGDEEV
jgi:carbon-monoxide dehydrogenase iron sulfur subunit